MTVCESLQEKKITRRTRTQTRKLRGQNRLNDLLFLYDSILHNWTGHSGIAVPDTVIIAVAAEFAVGTGGL